MRPVDRLKTQPQFFDANDFFLKSSEPSSRRWWIRRKLQTLITLAEHERNVGALNHARACLVDSGCDVVELNTSDISVIGETGYRALMTEVRLLIMDDIRKFGSAEINRMFDQYLELFPPFEYNELLRQMARRFSFIRE